MRISDISRQQAFISHLSVSAVIFLILAYLIVFEWYPSFYFEMDGGIRGIVTIFLVDVVLGPGLTLLVFKQGKKGLKFDLAVILLVQALALAWGIKSVNEDRPALTVFFSGRLVCLSQSNIKNVNLEIINKGTSGKQRLAFLRSPDTPSERLAFWKQAYENGNSEIYYYGDRFEPVGADNVDRILMYTLDLEAVAQESREVRTEIDRYLEQHPRLLETNRLYPIFSRYRSAIAVFDPELMRVVDIIDAGTRVRAQTEETSKNTSLIYQRQE